LDLRLLGSDCDGEVCVRDFRLAETAGMPRPRDIRTVIKNNEEDLRRYGAVRVRPALLNRPQGGTVEVQEYWLNEGQAIRIMTLLNTETAKKETHTVITVFMTWRHGGQAHSTNSSHLPLAYRPFLL
jgi:hypothetical protein